MKQTFILGIRLDDYYYIMYDYCHMPYCYCNIERFIPLSYNPKVGDTVYFFSMHYWYQGIVAKGFIYDLIDDNSGNTVNIRMNLVINPKEQPILNLKDIELALPNIEWDEKLLCSSDAQTLSDLWENYLEKNNIYYRKKMTCKAEKLQDAAREAFKEYATGMCEDEMLSYYYDLLDCCDDELLPVFRKILS